MPGKNRNLLLMCYSFPPNTGIGGRRWAKFAKHLAKRGYIVHVICNENKEQKVSKWQNDVQHENIKIYPIDAFYPQSFSFSAKRTVLNRISFRFWHAFLGLYSKGLIFDRTIFWKRKLLSLSENIIKEMNVKNVIVTIPPYHLAKHAIDLKERLPEINLILDYRDPWTDNKTFHGFKNLPKKRLEFELETEKKILAAAETAISTTGQMRAWALEKLGQQHSKKCIVISNGFDREEINLNVQIQKNEKITFLFAGSIYTNLEYLLVPFFDFLNEQEINDPSFIDKYEFLFYGSVLEKYKELVISKNINSVAFKGSVSREELNQHYLESDFFMMFTVKDHAYNFNTKYFEYLAYKKPIIHFSPNGAVTAFLLRNNLGYGVRPEMVKEDLSTLFELIDQKKFVFNFDFDPEQYEVGNLTSELEKTFL